MTKILDISWQEVTSLAFTVSSEIINLHRDHNKPINLFGVPRGGIHAAAAVKEIMSIRFTGAGKSYLNPYLTENPKEADVVIDDIIDSGKTAGHYLKTFNKPFFALVDKLNDQRYRNQEAYFVFPWERMVKEDGPQDNIRRLIQYIGDDPDRPGLKETPDRVVKSYQELFSGYKTNVEDIVKLFDGVPCDEMILVKNVEFTSMCEHHILPFIGKAHIAYIPNTNGKVIGISKLPRILEMLCRRLQVQERLTTQVTEAIDNILNPLGSACVIEAQHLCMACRGVQKQESRMVTSSLTGVFRSKPEARAEFFSLIKG